jgi:hypothetical protein
MSLVIYSSLTQRLAGQWIVHITTSIAQIEDGMYRDAIRYVGAAFYTRLIAHCHERRIRKVIPKGCL